MEILASPEAWISLLTLTVLEIVLGIDNVVFIAILAGKLPVAHRYIYFAMVFSVFVEVLNLRLLARTTREVVLRQPIR
ncbi:MAG: hypothetical protein HS113_15685 [Verrucomicrobiales bacterium]|nr:hypothetical protein [Verrucomicrobiales bacterium]